MDAGCNPSNAAAGMDPIKHTARQSRDPLAVQETIEDPIRGTYPKDGETGAGDVLQRVAKAPAQADPPQNQAQFGAMFLRNVREGAIGAARIMSAACPAIGAPG